MTSGKSNLKGKYNYSSIYGGLLFHAAETGFVQRYVSLTFSRTRRPASANSLTARRQFQATGQPVSRTQASDTMTSRLPRYEAKCV